MQRRTFIEQYAPALPALGFGISHRPENDELIVGNGDQRYRVESDWARVSLRQYAYAGVCFTNASKGEVRQYNNSYITIRDLNNRVISNPCGTEPTYQDDRLQPMFQNPRVHGVLHHDHDVCVDADENLYLCQWNAKGVPPIQLERV